MAASSPSGSREKDGGHCRSSKRGSIWSSSGHSSTSPGPLFATAANDNWTHGQKTLLYMRVNFPDDLTEPISEAGAYNVMNQVSAFYTTGFYDDLTLERRHHALVGLQVLAPRAGEGDVSGLGLHARHFTRVQCHVNMTRVKPPICGPWCRVSTPMPPRRRSF